MGLSDKEHHARAMLMGLRYHHGNGDPFYYSIGGDGVIDVSSMIDANTFEPLWEGNKTPTNKVIRSSLEIGSYFRW